MTIYTVTESWSKGDLDSSISFTTKTPLIFSESGEALLKLGWTFKQREWHPQVSKHEIIRLTLDEIERRQTAIKERRG